MVWTGGRARCAGWSAHLPTQSRASAATSAIAWASGTPQHCLDQGGWAVTRHPSPRPRHISMEGIPMDRRCEVYQGKWCSDPYALLPAGTPTMAPAAANRLAVQSLGGRDVFQRYHASKREHLQRLHAAVAQRYLPEEGQQQPAQPASAGLSVEQVPPHLRPQQQQPAPAPKVPPPSRDPPHSRDHRRSR